MAPYPRVTSRSIVLKYLPFSSLVNKVFVKGLLEEELEGKRFLFRSAADLVAVRGAVDRRPLLEASDFEELRAKAGAPGRDGGLTVVG